MDIRPVSLTQVALGEDGRMYEITGEAGRIAQRLHELDDTLSVRFNEGGMFFVVEQTVPHKHDPLLTRKEPVMRVAAEDWDDRVVKEWEMRAHELRHGKSAAERLDKLDAQHKRDVEHAFHEEVGEAAYPLMRAFQKDIGINPRSFRKVDSPGAPKPAPAPVAEAA